MDKDFVEIKQTIEIEKTHGDPLLSFNQAVTVDCSDFLGTALIGCRNDRGKQIRQSVCRVKTLAEDTEFAGLTFLRG